MPLDLYKRRHSANCLAVLQMKILAGKLKRRDLTHYKGCSCAWWVRGRNDYGVEIPRQSTHTYSWEAACHSLLKYNQPPAEAPKPRITLLEAADTWLEQEVNIHTRPTTQVLYRRSLLQFMAFVPSGLHLDEVNADLIFRFLAHRRAEEVRPATINLSRDHLKQFFKYAVMREWVDANPVEKVRPEKKSLDAEEVTLPLDQEGNATWQRIQNEFIPWLIDRARFSHGRTSLAPENFLALLELMYETGLRVSDATMFDVRRLQDTAHGGSYTTKQIKTGDAVTVFLEPWLVRKLRSLVPIEGGFLFYHPKYELRPYIQGEIRRPLWKFGLHLGLAQTLRPHRFRDSFAINSINAGVLIQDLAALLGHKSVTTTEAHYLPWVASRKQALERRLYATRKVVEIQALAS